MAENETAVVPPTSWKVLVSADAVVVGALVVTGAFEDVAGRTAVGVAARTVVEVVAPALLEVVGFGDRVEVAVFRDEIGAVVVDRDVVELPPGVDERLRRVLVVVDPLGPVSADAAAPPSLGGVTDGEASARALAWEPSSSVVVTGASAAVSLISAGGAMPSSTVETPVQATATAAALPAPHRTTYPTIFHMVAVSVDSGSDQPNQVLNRS